MSAIQRLPAASIAISPAHRIFDCEKPAVVPLRSLCPKAASAAPPLSIACEFEKRRRRLFAQSATKTFPDVGSKRTALGWNIEDAPEAAVEDVKFGWPRTLTALWLSTHVV